MLIGLFALFFITTNRSLVDAVEIRVKSPINMQLNYFETNKKNIAGRRQFFNRIIFCFATLSRQLKPFG